jgi:N-acylglucosamine-6-phosphate 2-epimerase
MIPADLRGLIVSIQPEADSLLNRPETVALLAQAAVANGASAVRIEGAERIAAVRRAVDVPIVGLIKRAYPGFEPYITPTAAEIAAIVDAGAPIVAFDATPRARPGGDDVAALVAQIHGHGALAMADCATGAEIRAAAAAGAEPAATNCRPSTCCAKRSRPAHSRSSKAALPGPTRFARPSLPARGRWWSAPRSRTSTRESVCSRKPLHDRSRRPKSVRPVLFEKVVRTSMENGAMDSAVEVGGVLRGCSWHIRSPRPRSV